MIFKLFTASSPDAMREVIITLLMWLPIILFSLSLHESAHAYVAYKMGDPTARNLGRVTLNPFKHLDPIGFLTMLVIGFGWAKPVPINARRFNNPRKGMAISSLAGPVSNFLLAVVFALFAGATVWVWNILPKTAESFERSYILATYTLRFFYYGVFLNVSLAVFNFIPIPPLDGSRVLNLLLPAKYYFSIMKYERYIAIGFMVLVIAASRLWGISLIGWIVEPIVDGLLGLVGVF